MIVITGTHDSLGRVMHNCVNLVTLLGLSSSVAPPARVLYQAIWASVAGRGLRQREVTHSGGSSHTCVSRTRVLSGSLVSRWPRDARDCSYGTRSRLIDRSSLRGFISETSRPELAVVSDTVTRSVRRYHSHDQVWHCSLSGRFAGWSRFQGGRLSGFLSAPPVHLAQLNILVL